MYNQHLGKLGCTFNVPQRTKWEKKISISTSSHLKYSYQTAVEVKLFMLEYKWKMYNKYS